MSIHTVRDDIRFALFQGAKTSKDSGESPEFTQFLERASGELSLRRHPGDERANQLTQVSRYFDGLSPSQQQEWKGFQSQFRQSIRNDNFDLSTFMQSAPESLKQYASDNGVDLESQLAQASEFAMELKNLIKSKVMGQLGGRSQARAVGGGEVLQNFMDNLFSTDESKETENDSVQAVEDQLGQMLKSLFKKV